MVGFGTLSSATAAADDDSARREVHVRTLSPPYGVLARFDSNEPMPLQLGEELAVTSHPHFVFLTCVRDMCEPQGVWIKPGTETEELDIALTIRPAQLQIEGNFSHRFVIQEEPSIGCGCAGVPMTVPLSTGERVVHVTDLQTKQTIAVVLTAGHASLVSFF